MEGYESGAITLAVPAAGMVRLKVILLSSPMPMIARFGTTWFGENVINADKSPVPSAPPNTNPFGYAAR